MKTQYYFIKKAVIRTILTATFYLLLPIFAKVYINYVGTDFIGWTAFGSGLLVLMNIILLAYSWALALDSSTRAKYLEHNKETK